MSQSCFSLGFISQNSLWKLSTFCGYKGIYSRVCEKCENRGGNLCLRVGLRCEYYVNIARIPTYSTNRKGNSCIIIAAHNNSLNVAGSNLGELTDIAFWRSISCPTSVVSFLGHTFKCRFKFPVPYALAAIYTFPHFLHLHVGFSSSFVGSI